MSDSKAVVETPIVNDADQLDQAEYQALESALLHTLRGRNFLSEYLRRNGGDANAGPSLIVNADQSSSSNSSDTDKILQAVENLHTALLDHHDTSNTDHIRMDILEMAKAISRTRAEIAAMRIGEDDHMDIATGEMDAIVQSTEKATNDILHAAEKIQEVAWRLREAGTEEASCEEIDNCATEIYMACSFQDLTGQRTTKVVRVLQYLEARISSVIDIWGLTSEELEDDTKDEEFKVEDKRPDAHLLNGPQDTELALGQDNIDDLLGEEGPAEDIPEGHPGAPSNDSATELLSVDAIDDIFDTASVDEEIDEDQLKALFN